MFAPIPARLFHSLLLLVLITSSAQLRASELAESVIRSSALGEIIDHYPAMLTEGLSRGLNQAGSMDPMVKGAITAMVGQAFSRQRIRNQVITDLDRGLVPTALETVRDWYQTPLGQQVARLEAAAARPPAWRAIERAGPKLIQQYQGTAREQLFSQFDRASRATESAVDTAVAVQIAFRSAMSAFNGKGADFDRIREQVESQRSVLRGLVEPQVYAAYLYTYETLSETQLKVYLDFMQTPEGDRYNEVVTGAIHQAILRPIESIGTGLMQFFGGSKG